MMRLSMEVELDQFGVPFVIASDGTTIFGEITNDTGLLPAPIKLSEGRNMVDEFGRNHGYGLKHIKAGHEMQILSAGFSSVASFVENVARNYDTIREGYAIGTSQTYLLELTDALKNTLFVELSRDETYWNVNSAGIFREKYSRKKKTITPLPEVREDTFADVSGVNHGHR